MNKYTLAFKDVDATKIALTGGKGANLGELSKLSEVQVPQGFCITTDAYKIVVNNCSALVPLLDLLATLTMDDRANIAGISEQIRHLIEMAPIPDDMELEIANELEHMGDGQAFAIRSSATAEDLPLASFAGQHDTYLNIVGKEAIIKSVRKCWASVFTERAIIYRLQQGFDHLKVHLSVIVQEMVFPEVSGTMFTADPLTSNRKIVSIDSSFGLGEAQVSGLITADNYKVRGGKIIGQKISLKQVGVYASKNGGTMEQEIPVDQQDEPSLSLKQVLQLEYIGRKIEAHFGNPQDIEWCLANDVLYIVQSRPITTLYPIPQSAELGNRVFVSVGHHQMMTDAMKPLGLSFFNLIPGVPMLQAGGRLFVDVTAQLASPDSRKELIEAFGQSDLLIKDALVTIASRRSFIQPQPSILTKNAGYIDKKMSWKYLALFEGNADIVTDFIKESQQSLALLKENISTKSGTALFDFIIEDIPQLRQLLFLPKSSEFLKVGFYARSWINQKMKTWLNEQKAADALSQSVPHNITSEMGLALLDVADAIRPYPEVIAYLQQTDGDQFLDKLPSLNGGQIARAAIDGYLEKYGMRCSGEIDITKPRWSERPSTLVPIILGNIKNCQPGEHHRKFEQGKNEAFEKEQELLSRAQHLPNGSRKIRETKRMIGLLRKFIGYREYPKYAMVNRYLVYKQALLKEANLLVKANLIREPEDCYYLSFEEMREVVRTQTLDYRLISNRKSMQEIYERLKPPRVFTSDGEIISGSYKRQDLPTNAMAGIAVSSGIAEGRARVISNMEDALINDGDILVTTFTDPSWTPLFVSIKGLVTEVGGMMTHGSVIAREYGLPAVVGVPNATSLIKDGQCIRVNGTDGYVEMLD